MFTCRQAHEREINLTAAILLAKAPALRTTRFGIGPAVDGADSESDAEKARTCMVTKPDASQRDGGTKKVKEDFFGGRQF
jgi:hypothetical protein